ncbi:hypothetical protein AB0M39_04175 [Streptomyces sp. NPDC051907]|uniref:hypothetical protein n=1 Tax=Streptomyces sp. NPDC051907 TaxID=3155284 RepID=UPI00343B8B47
MTLLPVRLVLAAGAAEVHLRRRFPRLMWALTPHPPERDQPLAELQRIESDPAYRAVFLAGLDAAIAERHAGRATELEEMAAAADRLRSLVQPGNGERAL